MYLYSYSPEKIYFIENALLVDAINEDDNEKIEYINSLGNLIKNDEISPESLNEALANYFPITRYLLTLYESVSLEDDMAK